MENQKISDSLSSDDEQYEYQVKMHRKTSQTKYSINIMKSRKFMQQSELFKKLLFIKQNKSPQLRFSINKKEPESTQIKYKFDSKNMLQIFFKNCLACEVTYNKAENQNPSFQQFFYYLLEHLNYHQKMSPQGEQIMKIRSYILREAMDQYCQSKYVEPNPKIRNQQKFKRRMSRQDAKRYTDLNILVPPPRMKNEFINRLFQNEEFKQYYYQYIKTDKLKKCLEKRSIESCEYFKAYVFPLLNEKNGLERVIKYLKGPNNSPLFYKEIQFYLKESQNIAFYFIKKGGLVEKSKKRKKEELIHQFEEEKTSLNDRLNSKELDFSNLKQTDDEGTSFENIKKWSDSQQ